MSISPTLGINQNPEPPAPQPSRSLASTIVMVLLCVAVLGLAGASVYLYLQVNTLHKDLSDTREALLAEISKINETSTVSAQSQRRTVEALKSELDIARRRASQETGQAKTEATKHADELAAKIQKMQTEQNQAVKAEISDVRTAATATNAKIGEVSSEVGTVKTDLGTTKSELEKTIASLRSAQGDLSGHASLIATNGKELLALKQLGERSYTEFKLAKTKAPQKVGDVAVRLKSTDPKKNRYTIELIADDKLVEKKDKSINEPVQFLLSRAVQPYEIVINEVGKDQIKGYLSSPKVQATRN